MDTGEPLPRHMPGMAFLHRKRCCLAAVVIPSNLGQPLELQPCHLSRLTSRSRSCIRRSGTKRNSCFVLTSAVPAPQELLPHTREGEERRPRIHPPAVELDAPALPAYPGIGFQQRYLMPGTPDQGGRGQPPDAAADYDHAAHG